MFVFMSAVFFFFFFIIYFCFFFFFFFQAEDGIRDADVTGVQTCALPIYLPLGKAVQVALNQVVGAYAIAVFDIKKPNEIVVAKLGSPLAIGIGEGDRKSVV